MAVNQISFSDPTMAHQLRQQDYQVQTGIADLNLDRERLLEDQNLFRPYLKRRFGQQADKAAAGVAGRGFHGSGSGIMKDTMKELGAEQTYTAGEFERGTARNLTDIERAIANLTATGLMSGGEAVRGGAGRMADELVRMF